MPLPPLTRLSNAILAIPRFASDAAGLEKTLRLGQAVAHLAVVYAASSSDVAAWAVARRQLALGRRYLRFFKFVDAYAKAYAAVGDGAGSELAAAVEFMKWSCLGTYLLLESCTILHVMDILSSPLGTTLLITANQFWFYALVSSLLLSLLHLLYPLPLGLSSTPGADAQKQTERHPAAEAEERARQRRRQRQAVMKNVVVDAADLLLPGAITGWLSTSPAAVGWATVVSTVVGSEEIWARVRREGGGGGRGGR